MPKNKGYTDPDPDFLPGKSRKTGFYDREQDTRTASKELMRIKCKIAWIVLLLYPKKTFLFRLKLNSIFRYQEHNWRPWNWQSICWRNQWQGEPSTGSSWRRPWCWWGPGPDCWLWGWRDENSEKGWKLWKQITWYL